MTRLVPVLAIFALAACQATPPPQAASAPVDSHVLAFAQGACGGCHAVEANALSPDPDAPEWPRIVNTQGLTAASLKTWLVDAHNYPEEMDFDLDAPQVDDLVAYMLSLRDDDYEPPIM
jgi:mono/diheme cytochrome c family protein